MYVRVYMCVYSQVKVRLRIRISINMSVRLPTVNEQQWNALLQGVHLGHGLAAPGIVLVVLVVL